MLTVIMQSAIMPNAFFLSVIMLSAFVSPVIILGIIIFYVIILSVILLNVVTPSCLINYAASLLKHTCVQVRLSRFSLLTFVRHQELKKNV
jgi:hypothetical protein